MIISPNSKQVFTVKGFDQNGQEVSLNNAIWEGEGGTIDYEGVFQAGPDEGEFTVTVRSGDITASAAVAIKNRVVSWAGDVPSQKWTTFYTKVLAKFATRKGLKLRVLVEVSDVSEQDVEEMRSSLLDLGLDDEIEVK